MINPLISVVMPFKNAAPWLAECLKTLQFQSYSRWELIAVDDGSTDESRRIVEKFAAADERISVLTNRGIGIIPALQTGVAKVRGVYVSRMDADDLMPPKKLETLLDAAAENPGALITGKVKYFSESRVSEGYLNYEKWLNNCVKNTDFERFMYRECTVASPNWLLPVEVVSELHCFEDLRYPEDYHLILRLYAGGVPFVGVNEITHLWREHPDRTSRNSKYYNQCSFFDLKVDFWCDVERDPNRTTVIVGAGKKAGHAVRVLKNRNLPYRRVGLFETPEIECFEVLKTIEKPQVLVAVWPGAKEREEMLEYFESVNVVEGVDLWFL